MTCARPAPLLALLLLTAGCPGSTGDDDVALDDDDAADDDDDSAPDDDDDSTDPDPDADGDGVTVGEGDCDDSDPLVFPGQWDAPHDRVDVDCDGTDSTGLAFADGVLLGQDAFEHNGRSLASLGDVDGDGVADVVSGAPNNGGPDGRGMIWLWHGSTLAGGGSLGPDEADVAISGTVAGGMAGHWVAGAGDVDGDGAGDLLVGAPRVGILTGEAYLVLAAQLPDTGTFDLADAHVTFVAEGEYDEAGDLVASAGDVDGDGLDDVLVGAPANDAGGEDAGRVYLFLGSSLTQGGAVPLADADATFTGQDAGDHAGHAAISIGDLDGDGLPDLAIGAWGSSAGGMNSGSAAVFLAASIGAGGDFGLGQADTLLVGQPGERAGWALAAGEFDGSGVPDLVVSAHLSDQAGTGAGAAWLVQGEALAAGGSLSLADSHGVFLGEGEGDAYDQAGQALATAGDVDGDGLDDLLVGAFFNDDGGFNAGKTYLLLGSRLATGGVMQVGDAAAAFTGENLFLEDPTLMHDQAGETLAAAGDLNGDGLADFLIGAPDVFDGVGKTYVVFGRVP